MSETIVAIVSLEGTLGGPSRGVIQSWDMTLAIVKTDMTREEASQSLRDRRQYRLVEVFDQEDL